MMLSKGAPLSPKLLELLDAFEEKLAGRLKALKPAGIDEVVSLSWMRAAKESLCGIHADMDALTTALEFPVSDWENKWVDVYLHNSLKWLDIDSTFKSHIFFLKEGHLRLLCSWVDLDCASADQFMEVWRQHLGSKNPRLDEIFPAIDLVAKTLEFPKIKNCPKGRVLLQANYGVEVVSLLICRVFAAAFSSSTKKLADIKPSKTCLWAEAYTDLQTCLNTELTKMQSKGIVFFLKELEAVGSDVKKLQSPIDAEVLQKTKSDLEQSLERLYQGLNMFEREVDGFFQDVFKRRKVFVAELRRIDYFSEERELTAMLKSRLSW